MKDFLGNELNVGDEVAYISGSYKEFGRGIIEKIGKKMLTIPRPEGQSHYTQQGILRYPEQVIKVMDVNGLSSYMFLNMMQKSLDAMKDPQSNTLAMLELESTIPVMMIEKFTGVTDPRSMEEAILFDAYLQSIEGDDPEAKEKEEALIAFYKKELEK